MSARAKKSQIEALPIQRKAKGSSRGNRLIRRLKKLQKLWTGWVQKVNVARPARNLRVLETVSLGEKRIVAVVQFEQQRFLVGACGTSVSLLSTLEQSRTRFAVALANTDTSTKAAM